MIKSQDDVDAENALGANNSLSEEPNQVSLCGTRAGFPGSEHWFVTTNEYLD